MHREEELLYIAEHYGFETQCQQCIEEMAELTQAICKLKRAETLGEQIVCMENLQEEIGDVEIMIQQLKLLCGKAAVEQSVDYKIQRQIERIKREIA